ncbi:MAG: S-methyl-5-thioribose-1-phosphate isomerase, partial [Pseudonocardia sp.]|nr:S-methyl-5-thioribose-1-phosphate isomerase [Pseudonocardia sp.]
MLPRTIDWDTDRIVLVDQTALPDVRVTTVTSVDGLVDAIGRLVVRGAPALGVAGALGVVLATRTLSGPELDAACDRIAAARPTAANLAVG